MKRVSPGPFAIVWSCSGHSPPLSHMGQSSGWLISRNSSVPSCPARAISLVSWVLTTMPSVTVVVQAVSGLRWPTTSTRHWRQAPSGASSPWSSMVTFTVVGLSGIGGVSRVRADRHALPAERAATAFDVLVELFAEVLQGRDDRAGGPVAERAEGAAEDRVADVLQRVHVLFAASAVLQPGEDLGHPVGALAAGRALAAGLVGVEPHEVQARADDADVLGEHDHRGGAEQAAGALDALEVHRGVQVVGGEQRRGGAARRPRLERLAVQHAAAGAHDQLAGGRAER